MRTWVQKEMEMEWKLKGLNKFHTGRFRMYSNDIKLEIGEGFSDQQNKKILFNEFDQITVYIW